MMTVALTVLGTLIVVVVALNFRRPEKDPDHKVDHQCGIMSPQFKREMGALLGPAIVSGNRVEPLQNGAEIFPAMLEAIGAAQRTITFETYIYWSGRIGEHIEVVRYHRPTWYGLSRLNNRTHRKVLIIDGATGFTGGVGIAMIRKDAATATRRACSPKRPGR
jgi:cardiolipin synthase